MKAMKKEWTSSTNILINYIIFIILIIKIDLVDDTDSLLVYAFIRQWLQN
jgi:hypothetical protein